MHMKMQCIIKRGIERKTIRRAHYGSSEYDEEDGGENVKIPKHTNSEFQKLSEMDKFDPIKLILEMI